MFSRRIFGRWHILGNPNLSRLRCRLISSLLNLPAERTKRLHDLRSHLPLKMLRVERARHRVEHRRVWEVGVERGVAGDRTGPDLGLVVPTRGSEPDLLRNPLAELAVVEVGTLVTRIPGRLGQPRRRHQLVGRSQVGLQHGQVAVRHVRQQYRERLLVDHRWRCSLPSKLYDAVRTRLAESGRDWFVRRFLARRCDEPFLKMHLGREPTLVNALIKAIGSTMAYDANTDLLARLNSLGLLQEADRLSAARKIAELTIDVVDSSVFRDSRLASILTKPEVEALSTRFQTEIVGNLDRVIRSWEEDWSVEDERAHFEDLKTSLERYVMYSGEEDHTIVQAGIERINAKISELEDREDEPVDRHASPVSPVSPSLSQLATIFDDVDE